MLPRAMIARRLEADRDPGAIARFLGAVWGSVGARGVCRPLTVPPDTRVIGIGGATLGGSCKTPFAIALALKLAARGLRVAFVAHGYRAHVRSARVVAPSSDVREVGDDALLAARRLFPSGIEVIAGPTRQAAVHFAACRAPNLIVDGLLQTRPQRLARSLLLLDASRRWGNGKCPPAGDLRAPVEALLRAPDALIVVRDEHVQEQSPHEVVARLDYATDEGGRDIALADLAGQPLGLLLTIARPGRVMQSLLRRGLHPLATVAFADHHCPTDAEFARATAAAPPRIAAWLTTAKCATKLPSMLRGAPILVLKHELHLPGPLVEWAASDEPSRSAGVTAPKEQTARARWPRTARHVL